MRCVSQDRVVEWSYESGKRYRDPFSDISLDVRFTEPDGMERTVHAVWAGGQRWCVRYASAHAGLRRYATVCSDSENADLHGIENALHLAALKNSTQLQARGCLRRPAGRR